MVGIIRIATSGRKGHLPRFPGRRFGHHRAAQVIRENCATGALRYADEFAHSLAPDRIDGCGDAGRSEEHTSELQSLMRISYAVFCLKKKKEQLQHTTPSTIRAKTTLT